MSHPRLPAELLDYVVDHLHDTQDALKNCCLVSKSWVPRTRKHLFAGVWLRTPMHLRLWKRTFPDPSTSPARYTKELLINRPQIVTAADAEPGGCIRGFSRVEQLAMGTPATDFNFRQPTTPLVPFHGFSPAMKSLRLAFLSFPLPQIFNLILSFPLLEDLAVLVFRQAWPGSDDDFGVDEMPTAQLSALPVFTGSLELHLLGGMKPFTRRLLSLPGGIHFRELNLTWFCEEDLSLITALVKGCSHTLESLNVTCKSISAFILHLHPRR
jgi:hypothetical protein